jgi:hypothetical protein
MNRKSSCGYATHFFLTKHDNWSICKIIFIFKFSLLDVAAGLRNATLIHLQENIDHLKAHNKVFAFLCACEFHKSKYFRCPCVTHPWLFRWNRFTGKSNYPLIFGLLRKWFKQKFWRMWFIKMYIISFAIYWSYT